MISCIKKPKMFVHNTIQL